MDDQFSSETVDFRTLVNYIDGIALWVVSEMGQFEYVSAGIEDIWGISAEEIQKDATHLLEGIHPEDRDYVCHLMEQSADKVSEESYENRVVQPDRTTRWVHTRQIPIRDHDGNLVRVVGITTDITEQKRREREFAALNRIIRHDIRNDLGIILGWGKLLEENVNEEGVEVLEKILASAEHVVELTEIARDYAQTIADRSDMDIQSISLREILQQEVELRREVFPKAEFRITGPIPDIEVIANEMLSSVFRNLFNNAVQHHGNGTPVIEISFDGDDAYVEVNIADNGPGIPDDQKDSIFKQGEKGLQSSGTGIGLYLVQTLVEQYGGGVWISDNTPTGTVFHIQLQKAN